MISPRRDRALLAGLTLALIGLPAAALQEAPPQVASTEAAAEATPGLLRGPRIVVRAGDKPEGGEGGAISRLGLAVTNGEGRPGFSGMLDHGESTEPFVWLDGRVLWRGRLATDHEVGIPSPLTGFGKESQFVFRTLVDFLDSLWSHRGLLLKKGPFPLLGESAEITLSRRPTMTRDGTAHWVSEFKSPAGRGRALLRSRDANPDAIEIVLRSGSEVDGHTIASPRGLDLSYQVSGSGEHLAQVVQLVTETPKDDDAVLVDRKIVLREGEAAGPDDRWARFKIVAVNDSGHYLVAGETDGIREASAVLAHDGIVGVREGDTLDGTPVASDASVMAASIGDDGRVAHLWSTNGFGAMHLFAACDGKRLDLSKRVVSSGVELDLGDGHPPTVIRNFEHVGHGPAIWLGSSDEVFVQVILQARTAVGPSEHNAILALPLESCPPDAVTP